MEANMFSDLLHLPRGIAKSISLAIWDIGESGKIVCGIFIWNIGRKCQVLIDFVANIRVFATDVVGTRDLQHWLVGLGVWFSLWVREVPGSNPGRAQHFLHEMPMPRNDICITNSKGSNIIWHVELYSLLVPINYKNKYVFMSSNISFNHLLWHCGVVRDTLTALSANQHYHCTDRYVDAKILSIVWPERYHYGLKKPTPVEIKLWILKVSTARWSRGMILASGARGPGFNSRTSPPRFDQNHRHVKANDTVPSLVVQHTPRSMFL